MSAAVVRAAQQRCRILSAFLPTLHCSAQAPAQIAGCACGRGMVSVIDLCGLGHLLLSLSCHSVGQCKPCIVHSVMVTTTTASNLAQQGEPQEELMLTCLSACAGQAPHGHCGLCHWQHQHHGGQCAPQG